MEWHDIHCRLPLSGIHGLHAIVAKGRRGFPLVRLSIGVLGQAIGHGNTNRLPWSLDDAVLVCPMPHGFHASFTPSLVGIETVGVAICGVAGCLVGHLSLSRVCRD